MTEERLLTPEQVAEHLQLSPHTIPDYLRTKRLREVDLQAFIKAHLANGQESS